MAHVTRLRRMNPEEVRWRTGVALRTGGQYLRTRLRQPRWDRRNLQRILAPGLLDEAMRSAIRTGHWHTAHEALAGTIRRRATRFVLDPASSKAVRETVLSRWPSAARQAAARAERILSGEHDVLGYRGLSFARNGEGIDWHLDPVHDRRAPRVFHATVPYLDPGVGDHKIIWEINRHQHWLRLGRAAWLTGDAQYARAMLGDLDSWLAANPPLVGINWASMLEIGFRTISWTWAAHCLLGMEGADWRVRSAEPDPHSIAEPAPQEFAGSAPRTPWLVDLFVGLHRQLRHVEQNLSYYFSPNTHLTGEALALYVAGTAFPELAGSTRWAATGRQILLREIDQQILADGGHAERSTHYQRYTLDFYLLALLTARRARDRDAAARFADAAGRLAEFTRAVADDHGRLPLIGDDDGGMLWPLTGRACSDVRDSLAVAAFVLGRPDLAPWGATEEAVWIAGPDAAVVSRHRPDGRRPDMAASRTLADTGYFVARDDRGGHAVLDGGAHGYRNGGHAHADALAVTLSLGYRPLLVDRGTSTYTVNPALRDRMRSSASHNTITVDGRSPSMPAGPFHWQSCTDARLAAWRHNNGFDWVEASHDGYAPLEHRRSLLRARGGGWLIADEILGGGRHAAAAHWHLDPAWAVRAEPGRLQASHVSGDGAWLLHDGGRAELFHGDEESGLGWHAPVYGTLLPAWSARVTAEGDAPLALITWIGDAADWRLPSLTRIMADGAQPAIAAQVRDGERVAIFLLRPGGPVPQAARTCRVADYETDARVLQYTAAGDRLVSMALIDARWVTTMRHGWVSIEGDEPIPDLSVSLAAGTLDLQASTPPALLRVRSATRFHSVRLNGHALPLAGASRADGLRVHASEWPGNRRISPPARPWLDPGAAFARH